MRKLRGAQGVLFLALILFISAACSGGEVATPTPTRPALDLQLIVGSTDLSLGSNRVVFAILDANSNTLRARTAQVKTFYPASTDKGILVEKAIGQFHQWPVAGGAYTAQLFFDQAGVWGLEVAITDGEGAKRVGRTAFQVKRQSATPAIGSPAPRSENKTSSVAGLEELTTDPSPDQELYTKTISQAIDRGIPLVVAFSTPAFCQTFTCGPQLEIIKGLKERYAEQINFIHVEIYDNPHQIQGDLTRARISPTVLEWQLTSEPWTFVLDKQGLVSSKFAGFTTEKELEGALIRALKSARGVVTKVSPASFLGTYSFTILTPVGISMEFIVDETSDMGHFTPSHLRQHGLAGESVTVSFKNMPEGLVVERVKD